NLSAHHVLALQGWVDDFAGRIHLFAFSAERRQLRERGGRRGTHVRSNRKDPRLSMGFTHFPASRIGWLTTILGWVHAADRRTTINPGFFAGFRQRSTPASC